MLVAAHGVYFPDQGSNLGPLHWEPKVLATGPPGKSPPCIFYFSVFLSTSKFVLGDKKRMSFCSSSWIRMCSQSSKNTKYI